MTISIKAKQIDTKKLKINTKLALNLSSNQNIELQGKLFNVILLAVIMLCSLKKE